MGGRDRLIRIRCEIVICFGPSEDTHTRVGERYKSRFRVGCIVWINMQYCYPAVALRDSESLAEGWIICEGGVQKRDFVERLKDEQGNYT